MSDYDPRGLLKNRHRDNAADPIAGYDGVGVWRESFWAQWLTDAVPIVVDANVIHDCVGRSAKTQKPTALVTIANTRAGRIFCAPHVIAELYEHLDEWATDYSVSPLAYEEAFTSMYQPLLRMVPTDGLEQMLLPAERARLDVLMMVDPDDVPTATLAIVLGALPITRDHGPWEAVYGVPSDRAHLELWLQRLMSVGDLGEAEQLLAFTSAGIAAPGIFTIYGASKLFRASRLAFGVTALAIGLGAFFVPQSFYANCWENIKIGFGRLDETLLMPHIQAKEELQRELPPFPSWDELVGGTSRDEALARACLYRLARSRRTPATVREIAADLPSLTIGQNAPRVGKVVRKFRCFFEPEPPEPLSWQVGHPHDFPES